MRQAGVGGPDRFILPLATTKMQKLPWLIPHYANEEGHLGNTIHSLLVEHHQRRIIVDTGLGNDEQGRRRADLEQPQGPVPRNADRGGFAPDSIDTVLCTICMSTMSAGTPNS